MKDSFADTLKQFRTEKNLSQQQLADMLFVERTHQHFIGNDRQHRRGTKHHYG